VCIVPTAILRRTFVKALGRCSMRFNFTANSAERGDEAFGGEEINTPVRLFGRFRSIYFSESCSIRSGRPDSLEPSSFMGRYGWR
jgi:hypothetical protein